MFGPIAEAFFRAPAFYSFTNSTGRLRARPAPVPLSAIGLVSPTPTAVRREAAMLAQSTVPVSPGISTMAPHPVSPSFGDRVVLEIVHAALIPTLPQKLRGPIGEMFRLDDLRIQPFDDGCIAQALRIVIQIVRNHSQNMKAFLQLKAERRIVTNPSDDLGDVFFGLHFGSARVISTQPRARANSPQPQRFRKIAPESVELVADSVMLQRGIDNDFCAVQRAARGWDRDW